MTVGGGKWTLRNGIFNHKIFNDILMIQFDVRFMKYRVGPRIQFAISLSVIGQLKISSPVIGRCGPVWL